MGTIAQVCRAVSSTIGKNLLSSNIFATCPPQYGELRPTHSGWDRWRVWGTPANFNGFVTAAASLNGSQPNFARCLAVSWAVDCLYIFGGCCSVTEFCQMQNSLCVLQVLHCPILATLLHGTRAVGASQTLRRWAQGATYIQQGDHHVGHWPTF